MLRSLGVIAVTIITMIFVFYGLRGFVGDTWPRFDSGVFEVLIFVISALYGFWFNGWLDRALPDAASDD
ncbi:hypothetical protein [Litoreibacter janthinus]|uniref:hypothetical protein n=1 Tax=Litoreibacter janthinus TaxID=670154 RepID=UPI000B7D2703|nr:hypothetical protein [Litoreibacter janthinus]